MFTNARKHFRSLREAAALAEVIKKVGDEYCVFSKDGTKNLGCFPTEELAKQRLGQIELFKRNGDDISESVASGLAEKATKEQRDPGAVCGDIWFNGTEEERGAFGPTEGRSRNEAPPKAWFDT